MQAQVEQKKEEYSKLFRTFSIFVLLNFLPSIFITPITGRISHDLVIYFRIFASLLCILLSLHEYWSSKINGRQLQIYWYFTLFFSLAFISAYSVFISGYERYWIINALLSLLLLYTFINFSQFVVFTLVGVVLGYICYQFFGNASNEYHSVNYITLAAYSCSFIGLVLAVSLYEREKERQDKMRMIEILSAATAHETKTPLASIEMQAGMLIDILHKEPRETQQEISNIVSSISRVAKLGCKSVDILLTSIKEGGNIPQEDLAAYSIIQCLKEALREYPMKDEWRERITLDEQQDFWFYGSIYLVKYTIFNLLKNVFMHSGSNSNIDIYTDSENCILYFKDFGKGIPAEKQKKIFERFYSENADSTGIGLSFCKAVMKKMGGNITCVSEYGEYTEFILSFKAAYQEITYW